MSIHKPICPGCKEPLVLTGFNGHVEVSTQHFYYEDVDKWFCNERCCELWIHRVGSEAVYEPDQLPN